MKNNHLENIIELRILKSVKRELVKEMNDRIKMLEAWVRLEEIQKRKKED